MRCIFLLFCAFFAVFGSRVKHVELQVEEKCSNLVVGLVTNKKMSVFKLGFMSQILANFSSFFFVSTKRPNLNIFRCKLPSKSELKWNSTDLESCHHLENGDEPPRIQIENCYAQIRAKVDTR